jgi:hypothetical protein
VEPARLELEIVTGAPQAQRPATTLPAKARLRRAVTDRAVILVIAAVGIGCVLRLIGDQPVVYDALGYVWLSQIFAAGHIDVAALDANGWGIRTYGYPAFLVPWGLLTGYDFETLPWVVFAVQIAIHLGVSWLFARRVASAFGDDRLGRVTLVLVALNPFVLILAGLLLTDFLSSALIAAAVALTLPPRMGQSAGSILRDGMLALLAITLATEVRPANAVLVPVVAALWAVRWWSLSRGDLSRVAGGLVLVGLVGALPVIPQAFLNWQVYGQVNPLVIQPLYRQQIKLGIDNVKYGTLLPPGYPMAPMLEYRNPFSNGDTDLVAFARSNPPGFVATVALHAFALVDQDYPFPYVRETDSWYRWPLSTLNYVFLWGAVLGLGAGWRSWWRPGTRFASCVLSLVTGAYILVYLPPQVESRYGVPLFTLLAPAAAAGLLTVRCWVRARAWRPTLGIAVSGLIVVGACAGLSVWMQAQAPALVMLRELLRPPGMEAPVARFDAPPPDRWVVEQRQTYLVRATNVGERTWYDQRPGEVYLHIMFVKPGDPEVIDTRVEAYLPIDQQVPPGGQLEMAVTVTAPRKEGEYRLRQQLELNKDRGIGPGTVHETTVEVDVRRSGDRNR